MDGRCLQAPTWRLNKQQPVRLVCINFIFLIMNSFNTQAQIITLSPLCFAVYILQLVLKFCIEALIYILCVLGSNNFTTSFVRLFSFYFLQINCTVNENALLLSGHKDNQSAGVLGAEETFLLQKCWRKKSSFQTII